MQLERLERALGWSRLEELPVPTGQDPQWCDRVVRVCPTREGLPSIRLHFARGTSELHQVGFSHWHTHIEWGEYSLRHLAYAIGMVRKLVRQEASILEEYDASGRYIGSNFIEAGELPGALDRRVATFRRVWFNRDPVAEAVPLEDYEVGTHHLIRRPTKATQG